MEVYAVTKVCSDIGHDEIISLYLYEVDALSHAEQLRIYYPDDEFSIQSYILQEKLTEELLNTV